MTAPLVVDDVAVWRFLRGDTTIRLHSKERIVAIRVLLLYGVKPNHVAQRVGVTLQYVCQIRDGKAGHKVPLTEPPPLIADDPELPPGRWVRHGLIQRWVS